MRYLSFLVLILILSGCSDPSKEIHSVHKEKKALSDQEIAEQYGEKMKPDIKKELKRQDINHFVKSIQFKDDIYMNPMGYVIVKGYVNNDSTYSFTADLLMSEKEVGSISKSPELTEHFIHREKAARLLKEAEEEDEQNSGK